MNRCVYILGVRIDAISLSEARDQILQFLASTTQHHVMTPNPEMLVQAHRDTRIKDLLHATALNVPDGKGLLLAAKLTGDLLPERVTGVDLLTALCRSSSAPTVFLLGAAPGVAEKAAATLMMNNPLLSIVGTWSGSPSEHEESAITARINASGASMLFVAYGSPSQDFWIRRNLTKMPCVRVAMGVGGAFDFLAGVRRRAPRIVRSLGLEWFWRLLQEPRRLGRILTAVIIFPFLVLTNRAVTHTP